MWSRPKVDMRSIVARKVVQPKSGPAAVVAMTALLVQSATEYIFVFFYKNIFFFSFSSLRKVQAHSAWIDL